ncbi:MAG: M3 family peptidase [Bacteroidetes bacterium]|jgi:peptidyl-dipeptidase Dcp|nr:M3 family peptidase [Bacteroidota bacterium]
MTQNNPLLKAFEIPPFSEIETKHFKPAIKDAIEKAKQEINDITQQKKPTFENTIAALDHAGYDLERISQVLFNLNSAETNEEIQQITQEVSPWLSDFQNDIMTNAQLFKAVNQVYEQKDSFNLNPEQQTLLDKHYKSFVRNGANLSKDKQAKLREIDNKLSTLSLQFGQHVLAETNAYQLHVEHQSELKGLPENVLEAAEGLAKQQGKTGYIFTLQYPSYIPFMKYCENRKLRKTLALAFGQRGFQNNDNNNEEIVKSIVKLRYQRAQLLGFKSHADYTLRERMAKSPDKVNTFLEDLLSKAKPAAKQEFEELSSFAKNMDGLEKLEKWDIAFYTEKLKQQKFNLDDELLKPYFPLNQVIDGVFLIAHKLYGLNFKEVDTIDKYHDEVKTYEVYDEHQNFKAIFFADFHPRAGKRDGAWMTLYKNQFKTETQNERPQVSIVCNFSKPTKTQPSLLTFNEVTTLFHEFGHALHGMLANTQYRSLSGPSVYWDFVELPSQLLENWCYEKEALDVFAKHYKSGEPIPAKYVAQIKAAANFNEGMQTLRQLSFGLLDLAWHTTNPDEIKSVKDFENAAFEPTRLVEDVKENCMSTAFSHIFQGGYSAGYYSYKWAEVLDADAFEAFKNKGVFDTETAKAFKTHILEKGGTEEPMILYKRFRGQEPNPEALLKRAGLLKPEKIS